MMKSQVLNSVIESVTTENPEQKTVKGKAQKKSGNRIGYNYIILKSLKKSPKNDVVKCLYIKSLTSFGICVIKEGSSGDSKDREGRDIRDRLIWQKHLHEMLQNKIRLPRLLGSFEENGNYYLVIERIKGKSLYRMCQVHSSMLRDGLITGNKTGKMFLDYMIQLVALLDALHQLGIVHRDVSSNNFMITPAGKVAVIDMELSYSLKEQAPSPPFQLGTYGYMSPEQEAMDAPAIAQDVFSAGAILLQVWTGTVSTTKLTNGAVDLMKERVRFLIPDQAFAEIVIQCLLPEAEKRPTLTAVQQALTEYRDDLKSKKPRPLNRSTVFERPEIFETIQKAIGTMVSPLLADEEKGWFSENKKIPLDRDKKKINKSWYASFNQGVSGVMYMLTKASMMGIKMGGVQPYIEKAINLIEEKYINSPKIKSPSLHFGCSGVAACLATAIREGLVEPHPKYFEWIESLLGGENQIFGFQYGVAGQGVAHWLCEPFLHLEKAEQRLSGYAHFLMSKQEKDGSWIQPDSVPKKKITRGFARGMAGIIYFLMEYGRRNKNPVVLESAQKGLEWLMIKSVYKKNGARQWRSSSNKDLSRWWDEGAPGIALAFLKGYQACNDEKYLRYATGALNNHPFNVMDNNLGQNRLAGLGEIYLEAHRILKDEEWLNRANWIAQVLMHVKKVHSEYGPYWLVVHERQPVADFMNGNSGVLHFLLRYCNPDKIGFPLLP